ncbi:MAG: tetratricopeptide repeat protein [Sandaracinaceae bacterium]
MQTRLDAHVGAAPVRRSRSKVLGCLGAMGALAFGSVSLLALVDLALGGTENTSGAMVAGACTGVLAALALAAAIFGFMKVSRPASVDFGDAKAAREQFMKHVDTGSADNQAVNAAAALMLDRRFDESRRAYLAVAEQFPERRGDAYSQVGAACYFLGEYAVAIEWYERALAHGADPSMMRDNIDEAREALGARG